MKDLFLSRSRGIYESRGKCVSDVLERTRLKVPLSSLCTEPRTQLERQSHWRGVGTPWQRRGKQARCPNTHSYTQNKNNPQSEWFFKICIPPLLLGV